MRMITILIPSLGVAISASQRAELPGSAVILTAFFADKMSALPVAIYITAHSYS